MSYIFRLPAKAYEVEMSYEGLQKYILAGRSKHDRKIGTTLDVRFASTKDHIDDVIVVRLYDTDLAYLNRGGSIEILEAVNYHGSQATTRWLQKILNDNKAPGLVGRVNGKYSQAGMKWTGKLWEERYPGAVRRANRLARKASP